MLTKSHTAIRVLEDGETWTAGPVSTVFLTQDQFKFLCEDSSFEEVANQLGSPMSNLELAFANLIAEIFSNLNNSSLANSLSIPRDELDELYDRAMFLAMPQ
jgi:hypothetical protein